MQEVKFIGSKKIADGCDRVLNLMEESGTQRMSMEMFLYLLLQIPDMQKAIYDVFGNPFPGMIAQLANLAAARVHIDLVHEEKYNKCARARYNFSLGVALEIAERFVMRLMYNYNIKLERVRFREKVDFARQYWYLEVRPSIFDEEL